MPLGHHHPICASYSRSNSFHCFCTTLHVVASVREPVSVYIMHVWVHAHVVFRRLLDGWDVCVPLWDMTGKGEGRGLSEGWDLKVSVNSNTQNEDKYGGRGALGKSKNLIRLEARPKLSHFSFQLFPSLVSLLPFFSPPGCTSLLPIPATLAGCWSPVTKRVCNRTLARSIREALNSSFGGWWEKVSDSKADAVVDRRWIPRYTLVSCWHSGWRQNEDLKSSIGRKH